jgi:mannose-1-phosphate guanylyltransferase
MRFDPSAVVGIFPSDHYFSDEAVYSKYVEFMFTGAEYLPERVVLLGIRAGRPETDYGWIELARSGILSGDDSLQPIKRFWEKPSMEVAENLMEKGCLWNSFLMIGTARAFLNLIRKAVPAVFASLRLPTASDLEHDAISSVYAEVPDVDFSRSILTACPHELWVVSAGHGGWSDFGRPDRVPVTAYCKGALEQSDGGRLSTGLLPTVRTGHSFRPWCRSRVGRQDPAGRLQTEIGESDATRALDPDSLLRVSPPVA